ncbi:hypothetical protein [Saccharopolyspora pogona]|uniref:hypothetical protein n=1 Tax=Saccharopolyspora pogona TaxID=333966 RepID=UPI001682EE65|nr:hypothetical protein [Saccharopolyspora pogona]
MAAEGTRQCATFAAREVDEVTEGYADLRECIDAAVREVGSPRPRTVPTEIRSAISIEIEGSISMEIADQASGASDATSTSRAGKRTSSASSP